MANPITFTYTPSGGTETTITVTPVNGTLKLGGGSDDRGGGKIPSVRAGISENGSCQVVMVTSGGTATQQTLANLKNLVSPVGPGGFTVSGTDENGSSFVSHEALVDVEIAGDSVQTAQINWKGTYGSAASSGSGD